MVKLLWVEWGSIIALPCVLSYTEGKHIGSSIQKVWSLPRLLYGQVAVDSFLTVVVASARWGSHPCHSCGVWPAGGVLSPGSPV